MSNLITILATLGLALILPGCAGERTITPGMAHQKKNDNLCAAVVSHNARMVAVAIRRGADPRSWCYLEGGQDSTPFKALFEKRGNFRPALKALINGGLPLNEPSLGTVPLFGALEICRLDVAQYLVSLGANPRLRPKQASQSDIWEAVFACNKDPVQAVRWVLSLGVSKKGAGFMPATFLAAQKLYHRSFEVLIRARAPWKPFYDGQLGKVTIEGQTLFMINSCMQDMKCMNFKDLVARRQKIFQAMRRQGLPVDN